MVWDLTEIAQARTYAHCIQFPDTMKQTLHLAGWHRAMTVSETPSVQRRGNAFDVVFGLVEWRNAAVSQHCTFAGIIAR